MCCVVGWRERTGAVSPSPADCRLRPPSSHRALAAHTTRHSTLRAPDQQLSQLQCTSIYSPGCQMYVMTENYFEEADCDLREDTQEQF